MALESSWIGGGEFDLRDMRDERGRRSIGAGTIFPLYFQSRKMSVH